MGGRLGLGEADDADFGLGEDRRGNLRMIDGQRIVVEHRLGEIPALADGHRGERGTAGDVTHRIDGRHRGLREGVHGDSAARGERDPCPLQPQARDIGRAAGGEHHRAIGRDDAVAEGSHDVVARLGQRGDGGLVDELDAALGEPGLQPPPHILVEAAQDAVAAIDDRGVDAQAGKDGGEFHRDIAAALDEDRMGERGQVERLLGGDAQLGAGNGRHEGAAPGGDQQVSGVEGAVRLDQMHLIGPGDQGTVADDLHARLFQIGGIGGFEPGDFLFLVGHQGGPIEAGVDLPAEARGDVEHVAETGGIDIELLGHAATNDAGAADAKFLDDGDPGAIGGRHARGAHPAGAGSDNDKIIAIGAVGHLAAPASIIVNCRWISGWQSHKKRPRTRRGWVALGEGRLQLRAFRQTRKPSTSSCLASSGNPSRRKHGPPGQAGR